MTTSQAEEQALELNWNRLMTLTTTLLTETLNDQSECSRYIQMLNDLKNDRCIVVRNTMPDMREIVVLGMFRAPASKDRHHSVEGGLVLHLLQMWDIWQGFRGVIRDNSKKVDNDLNDKMVWRAILHHDLNKVWRYVMTSNEPWFVDYWDNDTPTKMLRATNKSLWYLNRHGITLPIQLHHALLTAEGGYSSTRPEYTSVFAKVIYLLDEMSANVIDRLDHMRLLDSKDGEPHELP